MPASQESTGAEPAVEVCTSLAELFSKLPSFLPPPCTVALARGLVYEIVTCSVSVACCKMCCEQFLITKSILIFGGKRL